MAIIKLLVGDEDKVWIQYFTVHRSAAAIAKHHITVVFPNGRGFSGTIFFIYIRVTCPARATPVVCKDTAILPVHGSCAGSILKTA